MRVVSPKPIVPTSLFSSAKAVYIGVAGLDPIANPVSVYYDDKHIRRAPNPAPLLGGFNSFRGAQCALFCSVDVSMTVVDVNDNVIYSIAYASIESVAELVAALQTALTALYVLKAGDTMTGPLSIPDAVGANDIYSRSQLDTVLGSLESATFVIATDTDLSHFLAGTGGYDFTYTYVIPGITASVDLTALGVNPVFPASCAKLWSEADNPGTLQITLPTNGGSVYSLIIVPTASQGLVNGIQTILENVNITCKTPTSALTGSGVVAIDASYALPINCQFALDTSLTVSSANATIGLVVIQAHTTDGCTCNVIFSDVFFVNGTALTVTGIAASNALLGALPTQHRNPRFFVTANKTAAPPKTLKLLACSSAGLFNYAIYVEITDTKVPYDALGKYIAYDNGIAFVLVNLAGSIQADSDTKGLVLLTQAAATLRGIIFMDGNVEASEPFFAQKQILEASAQNGAFRGTLKSNIMMRLTNGLKATVAASYAAIDTSRKVDNSSILNIPTVVALTKVAVGAGTEGQVSSDGRGTFLFWTNTALFYSKDYGATWSACAINGGTNFNSLPKFTRGLWYTRAAIAGITSIISFPDPAVNSQITTFPDLIGLYPTFAWTLNNVLLAWGDGRPYKWNGVTWVQYATVHNSTKKAIPIWSGNYLVLTFTDYSIIDVNGNLIATNIAFGFDCCDIVYSNRTLYAISLTSVYASYDKGVTWTVLNTNAVASYRKLTVFGSTIVVCGVQSTNPFPLILIRSTDNGATWASVLGGAPATGALNSIDTDGATYVIVTGYTGGPAMTLYGESTDGGATFTWTTTTLGTTIDDVNKIATIRGSAWIVAGAGLGIMRRNFGGYRLAYRSSDATVPAAASAAGGWNS